MTRFDGESYVLPPLSLVYGYHNNKIMNAVYLDKVIYKITSPTGKIYIGQSKNINKRLSYYSSAQTVEQRKIHASILKYGWEAHAVEIIELVASHENINEVETKWIKYYDSTNSENGLNIIAGVGSSGRVYTREYREKLSKSHIGYKKSPETIAKFRAKVIGQKRTPETCAKISKALMGKKKSEEAIKKMSLVRKGKKSSPETRTLLSKIQTGEGNNFYGKKHSEESKEKMRETKRINKQNKQNLK